MDILMGHVLKITSKLNLCWFNQNMEAEGFLDRSSYWVLGTRLVSGNCVLFSPVTGEGKVGPSFVCLLVK